MSREQVEKTVEGIVSDIIASTDLEVIDVEYVKERDWYLRVFLNKPGGIGVEDCQWVSEKLEKTLDTLDIIRDSYYLEVSSPGLDRPLKKERDFIRHLGDTVELHMFAPVDGQKTIVGTLLGAENDNIRVNVKGTELSIARDKIAQTRLYIDF